MTRNCEQVPSTFRDPHGSASESNPGDFDIFIIEPNGGDPTACLCFSTEENGILEEGSEAEKLGNPLPTGYAELREKLIVAARSRCVELALTEYEPPLMYEDCLSVDTGIPDPAEGESTQCTICVEAGIWGGGKKEVPCPGQGSDTGEETDHTTTTGEATADTTAGATFTCNDWAPTSQITSSYYSTEKPEGWYHNIHSEMVDMLVDETFLPVVHCDSGRYIEGPQGIWFFQGISTNDLLWRLGLRNGYESIRLRGYDLASQTSTTTWYNFSSTEDYIDAFNALHSLTSFEITIVDPTGTTPVIRHIYANVIDCNTPNGVSCPIP